MADYEASNCDCLNTELRENYCAHLQVEPGQRWAKAIQGLVDAVREDAKKRGLAAGRAEVLRQVAKRSSPWVADRDEMGESCFFCGAWHLLGSISRHNDGCLWPQAQAVTRDREAGEQ